MQNRDGKSTEMDTQRSERLAELERRLSDLKARLPAHSVPPAMFLEMEELEEELARLRGGAKDG